MAEGNYNATFIAHELLDFGANPNLQNREKWTPLHLAARKRSLTAVKWLLGYNFEVEEIHGRDEIFKINKKGGPYNWTPLHIAAYSNTPEIVQALAEAGANVFKRSLFGYCPKNGINKYGLTIKLCQKYERQWVKKHAFSVKLKSMEEVAHSNLKEMVENKYVRMASKNKFGEPTDMKKSRLNGSRISKRKTDSIPSILSIGGQFAPVWQNCQMDKIGEDELSDTLPQTETSFGLEVEGLEIESTIPTEGICVNDVDDDSECESQLFANAVPFFGDKAKLLMKTPTIQTRTEKLPDDIYQFSVQEYKDELLLEPNFDMEFCQKEVCNLKDGLLSLDIDQSKRIKLLSLMKAFHEVILDFLYKAYPKNTPKESIQSYIYKEAFNKKSLEPKSRNNQMISFYNLVPEALIMAFKSLNQLRRESVFLKVQICKLLCDINYLVGLNFLQQIVKEPSESILVKKEAMSSLKTLYLISRSDSK